MKYFIMGLLLLASNSFAGDILLGQLSHHYDDCDTWDCPYITKHEPEYDGYNFCETNCKTTYSGEFRERHPLIGYSTGKYTGFIMTNSFNRTSVVLLRDFSTELGPYIRPSASIGIATGYDEFYPEIALGPIIPVALVSFDIHPKSDKFGLVISILPTKVISAGLRFKFN